MTFVSDRKAERRRRNTGAKNVRGNVKLPGGGSARPGVSVCVRGGGLDLENVLKTQTNVKKLHRFEFEAVN